MRLALLPACFIATASAAIAFQAQRHARFLAQDYPGNAMGGDRPMMSIPDMLRSMMCWGQPGLIDNEKCLKFLDEQCEQSTTGMGLCEKLKDWVKEECANGKGSDQETACSYAKRLEEKDEPVQEAPQTNAEAKVDEGTTTTAGLEPLDQAPSAAPVASPMASSADAAVAAPSPALPEAAPILAAPVAAPVAAPAAAPAFALAPAPAPLEGGPSKVLPKGGLPEQGFSEHSTVWVNHKDMSTMTSDFREEWPNQGETESESKVRICGDQKPMTQWCKLYLKDVERRGAH